MDTLEIRQLSLRCVLGVSSEERRDKQDVHLDLDISTGSRRAADSDDLKDAWNYRTATKSVIAHVEASHYRTVEALAEAVARICITDHGAPAVRVRVTKPGALRFAASCGITISRSAADYAESSATADGKASR